MLTPAKAVTLCVPPPDEKEIRRYAKCPTGADELLAECLAEMQGLSYLVAFAECPVALQNGTLDLGFTECDSAQLAKALAGCDRALLFAATVGPLPDKLAAKYSRLSPAKALWVQAIGAERVEALCDAFCREREAAYKQDGFSLRPRFSPGYGDLPLCVQRPIFDVLDCPRKIGLTLSDSLLMLPTKSVTAIVGIRKDETR